jgi:hypothetical protein
MLFQGPFSSTRLHGHSRTRARVDDRGAGAGAPPGARDGCQSARDAYKGAREGCACTQGSWDGLGGKPPTLAARRMRGRRGLPSPASVARLYGRPRLPAGDGIRTSLLSGEAAPRCRRQVPAHGGLLPAVAAPRRSRGPRETHARVWAWRRRRAGSGASALIRVGKARPAQLAGRGAGGGAAGGGVRDVLPGTSRAVMWSGVLLCAATL